MPSSGWQRARSPRCTAGAADAHGVALAALYGRPPVERGPLGRLQLSGAEEVGDLARHVEGDRQLRARDVLLDGDVVGHEVGDSRADGVAADVVVPGEGGDRAVFQVRGADGVGLVGRHGGATPALAALGLGGAQSVVGQLALEFAGGGEGLHHELHGGQQFACTGARLLVLAVVRLPTAAKLYADAARSAPNLAERHHLTLQAARIGQALRG
ncbi:MULTISPECIES: hypothetical protein [Actinoalloteichus]|uniref:hypothetical protein n=1 Tax=Actinoalloteichus TaxID=65496 RepID=UPI0012FBF7DD|nr:MULTISPECIES: hypothetical protein [Actinoalloteichus]